MKVLLAIGFYSDGTTEKRLILKACLESVKRAGSVYPVLFVTGNANLLSDVGIPVVGLGELGKQQGESAIGMAALRVAKEMGVDWIVKIAGDTFHPGQAWATKSVDIATREMVDLMATEHHFPDRVNTQVYCVKPDFMDKTWPRPQDARLEQIGIEPAWGESIKLFGLKNHWHRPESKKIITAECENFSPVNPEIEYFHAHRLSETELWWAGKKPRPALSIVMPARNECQKDHDGNYLLTETVKSIDDTSKGFEPPEIILVDDASNANAKLPTVQPGGCPFRMIRNPKPLGVDPSRNIGGAAASGDVIGILDAHCKIQTQEGVMIPGGLQDIAQAAKDYNAIMVGKCAHLELTGRKSNDSAPHCGANFTKHPGQNDYATLGMGFATFRPATGIKKINGMLGASYFFPRDIWQRLGGFVDCCKIWGYSEEGMALKAAFLGIPIYFYGDMTVSHWFRSRGPHPFKVDGFEKFMNSVRVMKVCFEPSRFESYWLPRARKYKDWQWGKHHEDVLNNDEGLDREAARFHAMKVRSDTDVCKELFDIDI